MVESTDRKPQVQMANCKVIWLHGGSMPLALVLLKCQWYVLCVLYPSSYKWADFFRILAMVNYAAVNIVVHICFQISIFVLFRIHNSVLSRSGVADWLYGSSIFNILGNHPTAFHSSYINLHSHHQYWWFLFLDIIISTCYFLSFW